MTSGFGLRSVSGKVECRRREASSETQPERNARHRDADGSEPRLRFPANAARDERAGLRSGTGVVERGTGPTGSPWSGANRALVTADESGHNTASSKFSISEAVCRTCLGSLLRQTRAVLQKGRWDDGVHAQFGLCSHR